MSTIKDVLNKCDRFAAVNGVQLTSVSETLAVAEMVVEEKHLNGGDVCQGGALFTLADLAFAAVMNFSGKLTLSLNSSIVFIAPAVIGDHLRAEAMVVNDHHRIPYLEARIFNQDDKLLAVVTSVGYRKDKTLV